ncbi:MAG: zinc ribbon domain-containing protein [Planctomycetaceae bacterium]|nr:zinc ribbon domain-containing protein [Planctomycetaceae bacterium]
MTIEVNCKSCGHTVRTKDENAGRTAKCPECGEKIQIPAASSGDILDAEEEFGLADDFDSMGEELDDRKPCPACGELIKQKASKCRYCGEIFDPAMKKSKKRRSAGADDEDMSTGDWVVAILCSGIGCIAGIVWMIQGKPKGQKMFLVSFLMQLFWGAMRVILEMMNQGVR